MKICFVTSFEKTTGNSDNRITFLNAKAFLQKGHDVTIIFSRKIKVPDEYSDPGIQYLYPPVNPILRGGFSFIEMLSKLIHLLFNRFDIIYVIDKGLRPASLVSMFFVRMLKKSVAVEEWWEWYAKDGWGKNRKGAYGKLLSFYDDVMEIPSKKLFHGIICISSGLQKRLPEKTNSIVIYGGAEKNNFKAYDKSTARNKLSLPEDMMIFGMSNLCANDEKDNQPFLDAFSHFRADNVKLLVTGTKDSIEKLSFIEENKLIKLGWVSFGEYNLYMSSCDYFVMPFPDTARNIGRWPNKFGDYMSMNRPVITNDTGDIGIIIKNQPVGILVNNTTEDYTALLNRLCSQGDNADYFFDTILNELSFENRNNKIEDYFKKLLYNKNNHE